jgi:hypothetical protein
VRTIEPTIAFTLFDKLLAGLGLLREGKKQRTEETEQSLRALYVALTETKAYIYDRENGRRRDRKREYRLAHLWQDASIPLGVIDKEFALRCFVKGNYWMEPDAWDQKRIEDTGIAINAVLDETRALLLQ